MDQLNEFADSRQKSWCIHCGKLMEDLKVTKDHVPSKSLLQEPYPSNLSIVQICFDCNNGFSVDEEYLTAFISCVISGSTDPNVQLHPKAKKILRYNQNLRSRLDLSRIIYKTEGGNERTIWKPESMRIERVITKNARGHALFEFSEPMLERPSYIEWIPLNFLTSTQRDDFENIELGSLLPEVGSRMMTRMVFGQDLINGWIIVQDGLYRYSVVQPEQGGLLVRTVIFEYLATEVYWV
jgi:hypothetical protein